MDNSEGAELKREALMKVLTGDYIGITMLTTLLQMGLVRSREKKLIRDKDKKVIGTSSWLVGHISEYELTQKGLDRLNGI